MVWVTIQSAPSWIERLASLVRIGKERGLDCDRQEAGVSPWVIHGFVMWSSWTLVGLLQIYTNRYLVHFWKWRSLLHNIAGSIASFMVLFSVTMATRENGFNIFSGRHGSIGLILGIAIVFLAVGGILTAYFLRYKTSQWDQMRFVKSKKVHQYLGLFMVIISQTGVVSGIKTYHNKIQNERQGNLLIILHLLFFLTMIIIGEVMHRITLKKKVPFKSGLPAMTETQFNEKVRSGEKLVLLDDLVLDVKAFINSHPGGKFFLQHNVGKDVSKFFYGGYSMEGNLGKKPASGYAHSNYARKIANDLAIGKINVKNDEAALTTVCKVNTKQTVKLSKTTSIFFLESESGVIVPNFKKFFSGLRMTQKHFLVRSVEDGLHRHYTSCNAMRPELYKQLIECLQADSGEQFDRSLIDEADQSCQMLTIKNYNRGMSGQIHSADEGSRFEIKGPLGKGLQVSEKGVHIAFAAGTGVLCFVDLVAQLILSNIGVAPDGEKSEIDCHDGSFKLYLYVSFPNRADSIALDLFEALAEFCNRQGRTNFDLYVRLSGEGVNPQRWDEKFVLEQMGKFNADEIKKVWVCGPPVMNETFDRAFSSGKSQVAQLTKEQLEIL